MGLSVHGIRLMRASLGLILVVYLSFIWSPASTQAQGGAAWMGTWQGEAMGVAITLTILPNGQFNQQSAAGGMMTFLSGRVVPGGPDVFTLDVEDWQPKTSNVYHASGAGGYYTQELVPKPPGGTWRVTFASPDTMTLQDVNLGGVITMLRVR